MTTKMSGSCPVVKLNRMPELSKREGCRTTPCQEDGDCNVSESASFNKAGGSFTRTRFCFVALNFASAWGKRKSVQVASRRQLQLQFPYPIPSHPIVLRPTRSPSSTPPASTCTSCASPSFRRKCRANSSLPGPRCEVRRVLSKGYVIM